MATAHDIYRGLKVFDTLQPGAKVTSYYSALFCEGPPPDEIEEEVLKALYEWDWHWGGISKWEHYVPE